MNVQNEALFIETDSDQLERMNYSDRHGWKVPGAAREQVHAAGRTLRWFGWP